MIKIFRLSLVKGRPELLYVHTIETYSIDKMKKWSFQKIITVYSLSFSRTKFSGTLSSLPIKGKVAQIKEGI